MLSPTHAISMGEDVEEDGNGSANSSRTIAFEYIILSYFNE